MDKIVGVGTIMVAENLIDRSNDPRRIYFEIYLAEDGKVRSLHPPSESVRNEFNRGNRIFVTSPELKEYMQEKGVDVEKYVEYDDHMNEFRFITESEIDLMKVV